MDEKERSVYKENKLSHTESYQAKKYNSFGVDITENDRKYEAQRRQEANMLLQINQILTLAQENNRNLTQTSRVTDMITKYLFLRFERTVLLLLQHFLLRSDHSW